MSVTFLLCDGKIPTLVGTNWCYAVMASIHLRTKPFMYGLCMIHEPNVCKCGQGSWIICELSTNHTSTVSRQLITNQNLPVFRANTKGCSCAVLWFIVCSLHVHSKLVKSTNHVQTVCFASVHPALQLRSICLHLFAVALCYNVTLHVCTHLKVASLVTEGEPWAMKEFSW